MSGRACIAVTRRIPEAGLALLREAEAAGEVELRLWEEEMPPSPEQLAELLRGCDGGADDGDRPDRCRLARCREPGLRVVSTFAVGYDNIDVAAATARRGRYLQYTRGVLTNRPPTPHWAFAPPRRRAPDP